MGLVSGLGICGLLVFVVSLRRVFVIVGGVVIIIAQG